MCISKLMESRAKASKWCSYIRWLASQIFIYRLFLSPSFACFHSSASNSFVCLRLSCASLLLAAFLRFSFACCLRLHPFICFIHLSSFSFPSWLFLSHASSTCALLACLRPSRILHISAFQWIECKGMYLFFEGNCEKRSCDLLDFLSRGYMYLFYGIALV